MSLRPCELYLCLDGVLHFSQDQDLASDGRRDFRIQQRQNCWDVLVWVAKSIWIKIDKRGEAPWQ